MDAGAWALAAKAVSSNLGFPDGPCASARCKPRLPSTRLRSSGWVLRAAGALAYGAGGCCAQSLSLARSVELLRSDYSPQLLVLAAGRGQQMIHSDAAAVSCRKERGGQRDVADAPACDHDAPGETG
jgi:hypothetical protein